MIPRHPHHNLHPFPNLKRKKQNSEYRKTHYCDPALLPLALDGLNLSRNAHSYRRPPHETGWEGGSWPPANPPPTRPPYRRTLSLLAPYRGGRPRMGAPRKGSLNPRPPPRGGPAGTHRGWFLLTLSFPQPLWPLRLKPLGERGRKSRGALLHPAVVELPHRPPGPSLNHPSCISGPELSP